MTAPAEGMSRTSHLRKDSPPSGGAMPPAHLGGELT